MAGYMGISQIGSQGHGSTCSPGQSCYGAILFTSYLLSPQGPPGDSIEGTQSPGQHAKHYLACDPALADWYRQLRTELLRSHKIVMEIPKLAEWDLVMHSARLYNRMGCQVLALDLGMEISILSTRLARFSCMRLKISSTQLGVLTVHSIYA